MNQIKFQPNHRDSPNQLTFSVYSSSPLCLIISGAMNPSVPPKPFVPVGRLDLLIPGRKWNIGDENSAEI